MSRGATPEAPPRASDAHLDAGDQIPVRLDDPHAFARVEEPQIGAFADHHGGAEGEDARKGDVEIGDDAQRRRFDYMTAKTMEIPWAGTPRIDKSRGSALPRDLGRIDPERGAAPIYVCVQVDQPGHDQKPTRIDDLRPSVGQIGADRFDPAIGKSDIGRLVEPARGIDDATAPQDQIRHGLRASSVMTVSHRPHPSQCGMWCNKRGQRPITPIMIR